MLNIFAGFPGFLPQSARPLEVQTVWQSRRLRKSAGRGGDCHESGTMLVRDRPLRSGRTVRIHDELPLLDVPQTSWRTVRDVCQRATRRFSLGRGPGRHIEVHNAVRWLAFFLPVLRVSNADAPGRCGNRPVPGW